MSEETRNTISDAKSLSDNDPILRIGDLEAAKGRVNTVRPSDPLNVATTIMWSNNFSQLPVMKDRRKVEGIISWKSIGLRLLSGRAMEFVSQCMASDLTGKIVSQQTPLLDVACQIAEHDYVFVRGCNDKITGIVTASDLSHQFIMTAQAFVTIGEIEYHLRKLFPLTVGSPTKSSRCHRTSYFPGFKAYIDAMKDPNKWKCLSSNIDVSGDEIARQLKCVNRIRDDVMHFKDNFSLKDGVLSPEDDSTLQNSVQFFRDLNRYMEVRDGRQ